MAPLTKRGFARILGGAMGAAGMFLWRWVASAPLSALQFRFGLAFSGISGASRSASRASATPASRSASRAFLDGVIESFDIGEDVYKMTMFWNRAHTFLTSNTQATQISASGPRRQPSYPYFSLTNENGLKVHERQAECDFDLSDGVGARFRMATGLAAKCDKCGKVLTLGGGWYHQDSGFDLCAKHRNELPREEHQMYRSITIPDHLGHEAATYALTVRVPAGAFPRPSPSAQGRVTLEVSHLINPKNGQETLASLLKQKMPSTRIEEYQGETKKRYRVSVDMKDEPGIRELIKAIGKQRGKEVSIKVVESSFDSPRF